MILAAGRGTRLRPLTDTVPKPLVEVAGRPLIAWALDVVRRAGIREVVINIHHLADRIRERLGDGSAYGLRITYSVEEVLLDTGGGIARARPWLAGDDFAVLNADTVIDLDLRPLADRHRRSGALVTMVLRADPEAARYGLIEIDDAGRVRRVLGHADPTWHPRGGAALRGLMYTGVMLCAPRIFAYLPDGIYSITRDVLPRLLAAGEAVHAHVHDGYWRVLDTPADLARGRADLAGGAGPPRLRDASQDSGGGPERASEI